MLRMLLGTAFAAYRPRLDLRLLVVFALATLIPAWSHATPVLTSADVSLTFGASTTNFGALSPGASETGSVPGCTTDGPGPAPCTYDFSLTSTGFSLAEQCNTTDFSCDFPAAELDLTNLVFSPSQILTNVTLDENDAACTLGCTPDPPFASRTLTSNSVKLSVVTFSADSGGTVTASGTFVTGNPPTGVPEPASLPLLAVAVAGLAWCRYRRSHVS
jgi:hypothetical protein